jgi:hypothetical protein
MNSIKTWEKEPAINIKKLHIGCLNCSTAVLKAPLHMIICVGCGLAHVTKDGNIIYDGEEDYEKNHTAKTVYDIEKIATFDPDHDWRIIKHGPMHGETFQRQGPDLWVCIESNGGFA